MYLLLEMLLSMVEFLLFHESTEVKKDFSLIDGYESGRHGSYGSYGSLCHAFLLFKDNAKKAFFLLFL